LEEKLTTMSIINVASENHDYDGLNDNSSDSQRLDAFFAVLLKSSYGEYVDTWKLKLKHNQQSYFEALLLETGFVVDDSGDAEHTRFKLTSKATILLNKYGNYSNFISQVEKEKTIQRTKAEEKETLEMQKLRGEVDDLTNRLFDYDNVKSRSIRSDRLAIAAIILTAIGLLLQWLIYKNG
jgi:hypothetical protein